MAEADHTVHPIGRLVHDVAARSSAIVLEETRLTTRKREKARPSLTEDETEVSTQSVRASADTVEPSDRSYKTRTESRG